jgi:hypothetical protein
LRRDVGAKAPILVTALVLDAVALVAFVAVKLQSDPLIPLIGISGIAAIFAFEWFYLGPLRDSEQKVDAQKG